MNIHIILPAVAMGLAITGMCKESWARILVPVAVLLLALNALIK